MKENILVIPNINKISLTLAYNNKNSFNLRVFTPVELAREALETGKSIHGIVVNERKLITQEKWDEVYSLENLIAPKLIVS